MKYRWVRKNFFEEPRPRGRYLVIEDADIEEVRQSLGQYSFSPNWEQSYFKGEDLNLARIYYDERSSGDQTIEWWQNHIRGFIHSDGSLWIQAHDEPEPTEYPYAHLDGVGHSTQKGLEEAALYIERIGFNYEWEEWQGHNQ